MKKWCFLALFLVFFVNLAKGEEVLEEDYVLEEGNQEHECPPERKIYYFRRYYCPHRRRDFYRYRNGDINATWPGKHENCFREALLR